MDRFVINNKGKYVSKTTVLNNLCHIKHQSDHLVLSNCFNLVLIESVPGSATAPRHCAKPRRQRDQEAWPGVVSVVAPPPPHSTHVLRLVPRPSRSKVPGSAPASPLLRRREAVAWLQASVWGSSEGTSICSLDCSCLRKLNLHSTVHNLLSFVVWIC
jgi:hypothetical protein